ncbi:MAG: carboxypeptidase regulatory-like domain-containing protein, partial [Planctomycetes bacterium]|nr:carboxypeptidase regulatory-like domain-containing protein [Planctomycetota bacterium]
MSARQLFWPAAIAIVVAALALLLSTSSAPEIGGAPDAVSSREPDEQPLVADPTERTDLDVRPRYRLSGRVRGVEGIPIDGARVVVRRGAASDETAVLASAMAAWIARGERGSLHVEADGPVLAEATLHGGSVEEAFRIDDLAERHVRITIEHDYYALPEPVPVHVAELADVADAGLLQPLAGGKVVGTIRDTRLAGSLPVRLVAEFDPADLMLAPARILSLGFRSGTRRAESDQRGRFEFRAVWPSHEARVAIHAGERFGLAGPFEVVAGTTTEIEVPMHVGGRLRVRVTDDAELPVEGARVRARAASTTGLFGRTELAHTAVSSADGRCTLQGFAAELHEVTVTAPGFLAATRTVELDAHGGDLEVQLSRGGSVAGRVVDPDGHPIANAGVAWQESVSVPVIGDIGAFLGTDLMCAVAKSSHTRSDDQGRFHLTGIPPGTDVVSLVAAHDDWIGGLTPSVPVGSADATITLGAPARIVGRVIRRSGDRPLTAFTAETRVPMAMFIDRPSRMTAVADSEDGRFAIERVPPGRSTLRVVAPGFAPVDQRIRTRAGETLDVGDIELHQGVTVRGIVRDARGEPVEDASIRRKVNGLGDNPLLAPFLLGRGVRSDARGRFELTCLPTGKFALIATAKGFAPGESERIAGVVGDVFEGVVIELGAGGTVEGRLLLANGEDAADWAIFPESHSHGATRLVRPDADGSFRIEALDPGRYNISAFDMATAPSLAERFVDGTDTAGMVRDMFGSVVLRICTVRAGETTFVELDASGRSAAGRSVRGTVTIGGRALADGWIEIERITGRRTMLPMAIVENGRFAARVGHPGRYLLQVRRGIFMAPVGDPKTIEVDDSEDARIELEFPGGRIGGRVVHDASGDPLAGAVVKLVSTQQRGGKDPVGFGFEITGEDGSFEFVGLDEGDYTLIADEHLSPAGGARRGGRLEGLRLDPGESLDRLELRARPSAGVSVAVVDGQGSP